MNDIIVSWLSMFSIAACVCIIVTWYPSFMRFLQSAKSGAMPSRIYWLATGLVMTGVGTGMVRAYSYVMREYGFVWLRDSIVAPAAISTQMVGLLILAAAYFTPTRQKDLTPDNNHGLWAGVLTAVFLVALKIII